MEVGGASNRKAEAVSARIHVNVLNACPTSCTREGVREALASQGGGGRERG